MKFMFTSLMTAVAIFSAAAAADAGSYYWFGDDATLGGAGTWSAANAWGLTNADGGNDQYWLDGNDANFGGTGSAVTLDNTFTIGTSSVSGYLNIEADGYSLNGGTINLANAKCYADVGVGTATVSSALTQTSGLKSVLYKTGAGELVYTGYATLDRMELMAGTLTLRNATITTPNFGSGDTGGGTFPAATGVCNLTGNTGVIASSGTWIGNQAGSTYEFHMTDDTVFQSAKFVVGNYGKCIATLAGNAKLSTTASRFELGRYATATGILTLSDNASITVGGGYSVMIGENGHGEMYVTGGTFDAGTNNLSIGNKAGASGLLDISGGKVYCGASLILGENATGSGALRMTGGTLYIAGGNSYTPAQGIYTKSTSGTVAVDLGGGTISTYPTGKYPANWLSNLPMTLTGVNGDTTFNVDDTFTITLSGVLSGDGGLVKTGPGALLLTADNSYAGNTTVKAGSLTAGNLNSPHAAVVVEAGASLTAASITADTLTIGTTSTSAVPEPGCFALLATACGFGIGLWHKRNRLKSRNAERS